jgi:YidC/Oxa1 family membrane protein insertase
MEKRVLLAVVLSFVVLYAYQALFPGPTVRRPSPSATAPANSPAAPTASGQGQSSPAASTAEAPAAESTTPPAEALVHDTTEADIPIETAEVQAVFSNRGGVLKHWRLKRYLDSTGKPLDLVPTAAPPNQPKPFALSIGDPAADGTLNKALFKPSRSSGVDPPGGHTLLFEYSDASGLTARKEFRLRSGHPYVIEFSASVTKNGAQVNPTIQWGPALGTGAVSSGMTYSPSSQPVFYRDRKVTRVAFKDIAKYQSVEGRFGFAGVDDHYFLAGELSPPDQIRLHYDPIAVPVEGSEQGLHFVSWSTTHPKPSPAKFFFGPKDFDVLASIDRDLVRAIDFGMFSWLVVPLLRALKWVNGYIGNYGWSIVALTVLINLAMFPLRHKSVVSMRKMQELQPEVKAIQDRYAKLKMSDPARQKMNVELMNLYRERGVNPASGCVPMLLTMPVLFAFYAMLSVAIELRGAPFIGWIKDLSVYDPWFITPVVMGATQFIQTKMAPATGDPTQQKMMLFMPLIFMTMFIWAPSGLVLYWTVSNLWAIGQQTVTNRLIGPPHQRAVRPPAERRVKNAGAGKSPAAKERK